MGEKSLLFFLAQQSAWVLEGRRCGEKYTAYLLQRVREQARPGQQYTITLPLGLLLGPEFLADDAQHKGWGKHSFLHGFVAACEDELEKRQIEGVTLKTRSRYWQLMNGPDTVPDALMRVEVVMQCWKLRKREAGDYRPSATVVDLHPKGWGRPA